MRNIHLLPTDKPSRLKRKNDEFDYSPAMMFIEEKNWKNQYICITSDEVPKLDEWGINTKNNVVFKCKGFTPDEYDKKYCKKIILTTDMDLIKDGVQAIDDEFLEWFVNNPSCERVEIEDWHNKFLSCCRSKEECYCNKKRIIIPQEATFINPLIDKTMKNVHLLPTDKPSRLYIGDNQNFVFGFTQTSIQSRNDCFTNQHIYITSDEEIKEGDYGYNIISNTIDKFTKSLLGNKKYYKKIILTTDQDLIKDGVQPIDNEFLEWFVKNPSCEMVEVKNYKFSEYSLNYKIIIPQEEPKQEISEEAKQRAENYMSLKGALEPLQETLEEAAENYAKQFDYAEDSSPQLDFIEGAKWQAERMYSEEEVKKLIVDFLFTKRIGREVGSVKEWFEKHKKK